jgi:hypothetical protein
MPKATRVGKFRQAAKAAAAATASTSTTTDKEATTPLSRGQKKRMAKREQYLRRERLVMASLKLKHEQEQAKRIDGLDAIKEALSATMTEVSAEAAVQTSQPRNLLKNQKSRQELLKRESNQLELVMEHPAFQADPLATIREHLKNSLATQAAQREKDQMEHERAQRQAAASSVKKPKRRRHRVRPTRSKK